jgi:uncharacterized phage protein (TIGR01671 family)
MKPPTFRVWDPVKKRMEYFGIGTTRDLSTLTECMMSTGRFDKKDVEIFEGDIVDYVYEEVSERGEFEDHVADRSGKVIYEAGAFLLEHTPRVKLYLRDIERLAWYVKKFEVVGNVHEPQSKRHI